MDWITIEELKAAAENARDTAARGGTDFAYCAYWNGYEDACRHLIERYEFLVNPLDAEMEEEKILADLEKAHEKSL
jgi:hypothetical protein